MFKKMLHSNNTGKIEGWKLGTIKCSCSQTLMYKSERERGVKLQMHRKFCSNPPNGIIQLRHPKKPMTLRGAP